MDELVLLYEGETTSEVALGDCLKQLHESSKKAKEDDEKSRAAKNIPPDETTQWSVVLAKTDAIRAAAAKMDRAAARELLRDAHEAIGLPASEMAPPNPEDLAKLNRLRVVIRAMSSRDKTIAAGRIRSAAKRLAEAPDGSEAESAAAVELNDAQRDVVRASYARISGLKRPGGEPVVLEHPLEDKALDGLRKAGVFNALYAVADAAQNLPAEKFERFGRASQPT